MLFPQFEDDVVVAATATATNTNTVTNTFSAAPQDDCLMETPSFDNTIPATVTTLSASSSSNASMLEEGGRIQDATVTTATVISAEVCLAVPGATMLDKNKDAASPLHHQSKPSKCSCCCTSCRYSSKTFVLVLVTVFVLVVAVAVAVPLWLFFSTSNHTTTSSNTSGTNMANNEESVWDVTSRASQLPARILELPQVTLSDLLDASSPRAQAMDWLIYQDTVLTSLQDPNLIPRFALLVLAMATTSDLWLTSQPWHLQPSVHHCNWVGIDCRQQAVQDSTSTTTNTTHQVVWSMDLNNMRLTGSLPPEIGLLTDLRTLILNQNKLEGSLPSELFVMESLENLELFHNQFSSTISPQFVRLTNLRTVFLGFNDWTGTFPSASLQSLSHLEVFQLTDAPSLQGDVNALLQLLTGIHFPNLQSFAMAGLPEFQSGIIPSTIGTLTNMEVMILDQVVYNLPSELGLLTRLNALMVTAPFLPPLEAQFDSEDDTNTTSLDFVSAIPIEIGELTKLNHLVLGGGGTSTPRKGNLPSELGRLVQLTHLDLSLAALTGTLPTELGHLSLLQYLFLDQNHFEGAIPLEWRGLVSELDLMNLVGSQLTGTIPEFFCGEAISIYAMCNIIECACCESLICTNTRE